MYMYMYIVCVDFDLIDRIVGVKPCHPQARTGLAELIPTYEQRTPPAARGGFVKRLLVSGL